MDVIHGIIQIKDICNFKSGNVFAIASYRWVSAAAKLINYNMWRKNVYQENENQNNE